MGANDGLDKPVFAVHQARLEHILCARKARPGDLTPQELVRLSWKLGYEARASLGD